MKPQGWLSTDCFGQLDNCDDGKVLLLQSKTACQMH